MAGDVAVRIGGRIKYRREQMGLKQRQLADLFDSDAVNNQRISDWETGKNRPSGRYMEELCRILDHPEAWFLEESPEETPDLLGALSTPSGDLQRPAARVEDVATAVGKLLEAQEVLAQMAEEDRVLLREVAQAVLPKKRAQ